MVYVPASKNTVSPAETPRITLWIAELLCPALTLYVLALASGQIASRKSASPHATLLPPSILSNFMSQFNHKPPAGPAPQLPTSLRLCRLLLSRCASKSLPDLEQFVKGDKKIGWSHL